MPTSSCPLWGQQNDPSCALPKKGQGVLSDVLVRYFEVVALGAEAEAAGYKALCFTVDVPALSNREDDTKNK